MGEFGAALLVAFGAAVGGPLRFFVSGIIARRFGETFPWGTLAVNASGAFAIGACAALVAPAGHGWSFWITGLLGSYTTVSSLSLQTLSLSRDGDFARAALNIAGSVIIGVLMAVSGFAVFNWIG